MEALMIGLVVVGVCTIVYYFTSKGLKVKYVEDMDWDEEWF